eukprot:scaffold3364_cov161-Amphora_coffeaeformis.AAC.4
MWTSPSPPSTIGSPFQPHQDARLEKQVSQAAAALGDGVQKIVLAAKQKTVEETQWKAEFLQLLGNNPTDNNTRKGDMDILLASSKCERFVLRCVEAELPPNLIHCLRLLRVLELQHAAKKAQESEQGDAEETSEKEPIEAIGRRATNKVARLLALLCKDAAVGEQLRPHLFGLLALSGASYPRSGVHVAHAASDVITALADGCLTRQLIWFIHERKMILHMTDDIKELTGMVAQSVNSQVATTTAAAHGLLGADAEEVGLWLVAIKTVVHLVTSSVRFPTVDLVKDFDAAGGYAVLQYAIHHSTRQHGNRLIALLPTLACTPTEAGWAEEDLKLALNARALIILEDLACRSNPLIRAYFRANGAAGKALPDPTDPVVLQQLAQLSLKTALELRNEGGEANTDAASQDMIAPLAFDVSLAVLEATLQIFADHPENYTLLESRQHILTFSLLAFPCYTNDDIKSFGLKILEFVLTGVTGVIEQVSPVHATVEIFFCLAQFLMNNTSQALQADAVYLGQTLEKLLQFDQRVAPLMVESGILTTNLNALLKCVAQQAKDGEIPALETPWDESFIIVYRVLTLLVAHQPVNFSKDELEHAEFAKEGEVTNLHSLLRLSVNQLGKEACHAATNVFEAYLAAYASFDALSRDMEFVFSLLRHLSELANSSLKATILIRQSMLLNMIRAVLEARSLARDAFRQCRGYEECLRLFLAIENTITDSSVDEETSAALIKLFEAVIHLWDASIGVKSKTSLSVGDVAPLQLPPSVVVDSLSSQLSSKSPAALNRNYIRQRALYLDLATSWASIGLGQDSNLSTKVMELALEHVDPALAQRWAKKDQENKATEDEGDTKKDTKKTDKAKEAKDNARLGSIRNPDAVRLVIGLALHLAKADQVGFSKKAMQSLLELTLPSQVASTLPQLSSCGLCYSLTNNKEFGPFLLNKENPLSSEMLSFLGRVAAYGTSYMDFIGLLRCIAGPILETETTDGKRIRLPVISSAIGREKLDYLSNKTEEARKRFEIDCIERLSIVNDFAKKSERYPRLILGGDSINTIGVLMHQVKLEDRLKAASEEGRLKYIEIESVDTSATDSIPATSSAATSPTPAEQVWAPLSNAGFSYSVWMRHNTSQSEGVTGNLYVLDISSPSLADASSKQSSAFFSVWFDIQNQRFNVMSSASHRGEPISFPVSPLVPGVWHHVMVTYAPGKRTMMSRKSAFAIYVDGRPLETDIKVDTVNLPPNSKLIVGAPNAALAASGIVRGKIPIWEVGPILLLSTVLLELDATALYAYGPDFPSLLWGDRPQRLSLPAMATSLFSSLAETGEIGSVASALRRRSIPKLEGAGSSALLHSGNNSLEALNLFCNIPTECVVLGLQPGTSRWKLRDGSTRETRRLVSERIVNLARLNIGSKTTSTDAVIYGRSCVASPMGFSDSLQWIGGPSVLMPVLAMTTSTKSLAIALKILRESCRRHPPNLESMQAGGGYRMLALLLQEKPCVDQECLDQCVAFSIHGFEPEPSAAKAFFDGPGPGTRKMPFSHWVISDLEAIKHVLLNHQVWDLKKYGPTLTMRLLNAFNRLVDHKSAHKAFNARRLHMAGIVRWTLHVMIEASDLYSVGESRKNATEGDSLSGEGSSKSHLWSSDAPLVADVSVGGDPGNPFLQTCKNLLRRVLTFMLTPGDLEALAEALIYTVSSSQGSGGKKQPAKIQSGAESETKMQPTTVTRLYLVRLLEELIVDGVNEIIASAASSPEAKGSGAPVSEITVQPHSGGVASPGQPYLSHLLMSMKDRDSPVHPKHVQAQNFLSAFAGFLTPVWFAAMLEGCKEEATGAAVIRLLVLMLQSSSTFEVSFQGSGEFGPFILSIPRFSTCASAMISILSNLLFVPILHIHSLPTLDPVQLSEVFDAESSDLDAVYLPKSSDPSNGIFAVVAECIGRNLQLGQAQTEFSRKAEETNRGMLQLLMHRHEISPGFRTYCSTNFFIEPFCQTVCLMNHQTPSLPRARRHSFLADAPKGLTPTERFIGGALESDGSMASIIRLLRQIISGVITEPFAARALSSIFRAFPVHASSFQVKSLHLVIVEYLVQVVKEKTETGTLIELANCVGVCSVLMDQLAGGLATTEQIFEGSKMSVGLLASLIAADTPATDSLKGNEHALLIYEAAHIVRLYVASSLRWAIERQDEDLQSAILEVTEPNIESILLVPSRERNVPTSGVPKITPGSKFFHIWQSVCLSRCSHPGAGSYPELESTDPASEISAFAPLMFSLYVLLIGSREDIRKHAVNVVVALLQHKPNVMNDLLVADIEYDGEVETIDVVSRGGFRALLAAHEAAEMNRNTTAQQTVKRKYASFFEWLEKNQDRVHSLFNTVDERALQLFPGLQQSVVPQEVAVEEHQKAVLVRLTNLSSADRTIIGQMQRADLVRRCNEKMVDSHTRWKKHGFDDLACGAMQWKNVLRQLKGSYSLWEGYVPTKARTAAFAVKIEEHLSSVKERVSREDSKTPPMITTQRWKLDLSEGPERQRRRLLPNYEFEGLYNIDETEESEENVGATEMYMSSPQMEATTELLKDLNLRRVAKSEEADEFEDTEGEDGHTDATTVSSSTVAEGTLATEGSVDEEDILQKPAEGNADMTLEEMEELEESSSYELINGLLQAGDYPETSFNVSRCTGLEVTKALFLWCKDAIYVLDGFEQSEAEGSEPKIMRVEKEKSNFNVALRPKDFKASESFAEDKPAPGAPKRLASRSRSSVADSSNEIIYQHRSKRISFAELHSVFRRRYQLQQNALEIFDVNNIGTLIAFEGHIQREEVLSKILASKLPNSIMSSSYTAYPSYAKFISNHKAKIVSQWVGGKMTNFEFLMHLNSLAGRSFNDLTQYPVFPWVIADYESEELDLNNPKTFRDLSKPMGAIGETRAEQFRERYESLAASHESEDDPPPFHYGTHYSCAAYVLYYLMRLEPFSRLALALQGGKFDVADRLFHDIGRSWKSASEENLQDVRELIPEFFFLPDFLVNTNGFDFGETQRGKAVHDVTLPPWAKGDPRLFVQLNRAALESPYVTKNLHKWIDLVFGHKQRGQKAVQELNTFVHVTYEGEVDIESMDDPIQKASTIAQIQNFGQTPKQLERKPFVGRNVVSAIKDQVIDFGTLPFLAPLTPPFCMVGAPHKVRVKTVATESLKLGINGDKSVGDMIYSKGQLIGVGRLCTLIEVQKKYWSFGGVNNGAFVRTAALTTRYREVDKVLSVHDSLHRAPITAAKSCPSGKWFVTGCMDSTLRVWTYDGTSLSLKANLCGHDGAAVTCVDLSPECGVIATGCAGGRVLLWDLRTLTFVRELPHNVSVGEVTSVSINYRNGNVLTLMAGHLHIFDINGNLLGSIFIDEANRPTCATATSCPEWQENGVVAVTGHLSGEVRFWGLNYRERKLATMHILQENPHSNPITALKVTGTDRQDTLLVGDQAGKLSVSKAVQMDTLGPDDLNRIIEELS